MDEAKPQTQETPAPAPTSTPASTPPKKSFFKQKGFLIGLIVFLVIGIGGGAFAFVASRSASTEDEITADNSEVVETLSPEQLGLSITAKPDKKAVKFKVEKAGDIKTIEYQLTYEADSTAQERAEGGEERVQRGITGESDIKGGALTYESEWLDLGSCSRNVCKYDSGVEKVDLTLKIIKKNGKTYESSKSLEL